MTGFCRYLFYFALSYTQSFRDWKGSTTVLTTCLAFQKVVYFGSGIDKNSAAVFLITSAIH